jgi:hypothetical protein
VAHADQDQARALLETVLAFVEARNALSESMVGNLLERCGIKGRSRQKQHNLRKLLVERGLLLKERNHFSDKTTGYRHGNFYICGMAVSFEEEARPPHTTPTVSNYLSLDMGVGDGSEVVWQEVAMYRRHLACERRYQERVARLRERFRMAA